MKSHYRAVCLECNGVTVKRFADPEERDWAVMRHYQMTNHKRYRRWIEDLSSGRMENP